MPWKEVTTMFLRHEFVSRAGREGANIRQLCRGYGIAPATAYKWLDRFRDGGVDALRDRSRRPLSSPRRRSPQVEEAILRVRDEHRAWGARKIRARLSVEPLPSTSTITAVLHRHDRILAAESAKHRSWQRFEAPYPNALWQMDFKGHFALDNGRCHPLTVLDDYSRFSLTLQACADETWPTVQAHLTQSFRRYGLPECMLMDNGSPWGSDAEHRHTPLTAWLIHLGIAVAHSRPYHPQTLGKDERFHRSLKAEVLSGPPLHDLEHCQACFDRWRDVYNLERPHEALDLKVPASRYVTSKRSFPENLPPIDYPLADAVRRVQQKGEITFRGKVFKVGRAFVGYPVALHASETDGVYDVFFCQQQVARVTMPSDNQPK